MKRIGLALILAVAATAQAQSLGRLFFTPEQRLLLDNARGKKLETEERAEEPVPEIVSLKGVITRDDGQTTVWLNDRAVSDRRTTGGVTIHPQGSASDPVLFTLPQADRAVSLRVGQNLDVATGQVVEPYSPKAAEMRRALAAKQGKTPPEKHSQEETASSVERDVDAANALGVRMVRQMPSGRGAGEAQNPASPANRAPQSTK